MSVEHVGLAIDPETNDLYLGPVGELAVVRGALAVGQHARQRLLTFRNEWYLDTTAGVPWLTEIMGKRYDPALAEAVVKAELLGTHGVTEITSFSVSFNGDRRELQIREVSVLTTYDQEAEV